MRKKILTWMTVAFVMLLLLPLSASASAKCDHTSECTPYTCEKCGEYVPHALNGKHRYDILAQNGCEITKKCRICDTEPFTVYSHSTFTDLFGGFTYCTRCHQLQFHIENVNWFALIPFLLCLVFVVVIVILVLTKRGDIGKADRISQHAAMIEKSPETLSGHTPWAVTGANNPATALNLVKDENERPEN